MDISFQHKGTTHVRYAPSLNVSVEEIKKLNSLFVVDGNWNAYGIRYVDTTSFDNLPIQEPIYITCTDEKDIPDIENLKKLLSPYFVHMEDYYQDTCSLRSLNVSHLFIATGGYLKEYQSVDMHVEFSGTDIGLKQMIKNGMEKVYSLYLYDCIGKKARDFSGLTSLKELWLDPDYFKYILFTAPSITKIKLCSPGGGHDCGLLVYSTIPFEKVPNLKEVECAHIHASDVLVLQSKSIHTVKCTKLLGDRTAIKGMTVYENGILIIKGAEMDLLSLL
jgi:hypothetical protein